MAQQHISWSIKYRPRQIVDLILGESELDLFNNYLKDLNKLPPSLLLYGVPGTGKTTISMMLSEKFKKDSLGQLIEVYGSITNTIDYVRSHLLPACNVKGRKIIRIEEFDRFTKEAQMALRNIIGEDKYYHVSFILTCNEVWRVHSAIRSRSIEVYFDTPDRDTCHKRLMQILESEKIKYSEKDINEQLYKLIDFHYPRIRDMVNSLEMLSSSGKFSFDITKLVDTDDTYKALHYLDQLMFTNMLNLRQIIKISSNVRLHSFYDLVHDKFLELGHTNISLFALEKQQKLNYVISPELDFIDFFKQSLDYFHTINKVKLTSF